MFYVKVRIINTPSPSLLTEDGYTTKYKEVAVSFQSKVEAEKKAVQVGKSEYVVLAEVIPCEEWKG